MPAFSVIIPLYNGSKFIRAAIESVLAQTFTDWEIAVTDDGSKDDGAGARVVSELQKENPGRAIKLIRQQNKGLGGARNTAIKNSAGEILALLDQDDLWYPEKLAAVKAAYDADLKAAIVCHREAVKKGGALVKVMDYGPAEEDMFRAMLLTGNRLSTSGTCVKREVVDAIGYFSEDVGRVHFVEDYDFWLRAAHGGFKFAFLKDVLGEWILHESNFSSNNEDIMRRHTLNVMAKHYPRLRPRRFLDCYRFRRQRSRVCIDSAYLQFKNRFYAASMLSLLNAAKENPLFVESMGQKLASGLRKSRRSEKI